MGSKADGRWTLSEPLETNEGNGILYLCPNEIAVTLFVSLRGKAGEELQHCDLSLTGRDLAAVKGVFLKHQYVDEFGRPQNRPEVKGKGKVKAPDPFQLQHHQGRK